MTTRCAILLTAVVLVLSTAVSAKDLAAGQLLVASEATRDPGFAQTVVLIVQYDEKGVVGLVLNRRSDIPVSQVFKKEGNGRPEPVYWGGPVSTGVFALLRARTQPAGSGRVLPELYLITEKALLEKTVASNTPPAEFRVYVGYTGWTVAQVRNEVLAGLWYVLAGDPALPFDPKPETLWQRMIRKAHMVAAMR